MTYRTSLLLTLILLTAASAQASTHRVPLEYGTIQAGVDACAVGDTVLVAPGTYTGEGNHSIDFHGVDLVLTSEAGPEKTIIDCENQEVMGILLSNGETQATHIEALTIMRAARCGIWGTEVSPVIDRMIIRDNVGGSNGGGISLSYTESIIRNTKILRNHVSVDGGGINIYAGTPIVIENTDFIGNIGTWGGAAAFSNTEVLMEGCHIQDNWGIQQGGGLHMFMGLGFHINDCVFQGNYTTHSEGGGMWFACEGVCENTSFIGNRAETGSGGAIRVSGVLQVAEFNNLLIIGNTAYDSGAGVLVTGASRPVFTNCTILGNTRTSDHNNGAGVSINMAALPTLRNTIITANVGGPGIGAGDGCTAELYCCDVFGNKEGNYGDDLEDQTGLNGNISLDPEFCGVEGSDNYYIQSDSPCAPDNNDCGALMGALPVGCGSTATEDATISEIKSLYDE